MKNIFSNWRVFRQSINEQKELTGLQKLLSQKIEDHPKLGTLPPKEEDITEDNYAEAIIAVAKCIKYPEARERYLDAAYGRKPIYDSDHPYHPTTGYQELSQSLKVFLKAQIKDSVEFTYYVRGFFAPCDVARMIDTRYQDEREQYEKRELQSGNFGDTSSKGDKPSDKAFSELGLIKFKGNSVVLTKGNDYRDGRTWGWPTMHRFLNSFERNPKMKQWGPWYVEDISKQEGGDITEHGSHEWGLDVDMSIPTTTLRGAPEGFKKIKKSYHNISQGTSRKDIKSGYWGFDDVQPGELNLDACLHFLEHCFAGKYQKGWKVKNVWVDDILITSMKDEVEKRAKEGKFPKEYLALFGKQRTNRKWPKERKWIGGPVAHEPNHLNHFHVRLVGVDPEVKKAVRKSGTIEQRMAYLSTRASWEELIKKIQQTHDSETAKKAAHQETMDEL